MPVSPRDWPDEELLRHRAWVRRLARSLVHDENDADDAEQQTWLAALTSPPGAGPAQRAWFAVVVRNWVRRGVRGAERRQRRERAVARPERLPGVDQTAAEAEALARVARSVNRLPEPLRTVVLLRYYDGLPVRLVAERMDAPFETTRSRLRTAIRRLRTLLGEDPTRSAWGAALLTVAGQRAGELHSTSLTTGAIVMNTSAKVLIGSTLSASLCAAAIYAVQSGEEPVINVIESTDTAQIERLERRVAELEDDLRIANRRAARRIAERTQPSVQPVPALAPATTAPAQAQILDALTATTFNPATSVLPSDGIAVTLDLGKLHVASSVDAATTDVPERPLSDLSDEELLELARRLSSEKRQLQRTRDAWTAVLDRMFDYETRDEALFALGIADRNLGDHEAEATAFRELIAHAGLGTERGLAARYQLAWAVHYGGDDVAALREMQTIIESPGVTDSRRRHSLLNGSYFAFESGDAAAGESMLERLVTECSDSKDREDRFFVDYARRNLDAHRSD